MEQLEGGELIAIVSACLISCVSSHCAAGCGVHGQEQLAAREAAKLPLQGRLVPELWNPQRIQTLPCHYALPRSLTSGQHRLKQEFTINTKSKAAETLKDVSHDTSQCPIDVSSRQISPHPSDFTTPHPFLLTPQQTMLNPKP